MTLTSWLDVGLAVVVSLAASTYGFAQSAPELKPGDMAPSFSVKGSDGKTHSLADHQGKLAEFDKALATGKESTVQLPEQVPVRLLYHSAYVDGGKVVFRTDPYGWDDKLAQALGFEGQIRPKVKTHVRDIGP